MENCTLKETFVEHTKADEENYKHIRESLHDIRNILQDLKVVKIRNGGGRIVTYERSEFDQMLYDNMKFKWRDTVKDIALILSVVATAITVLTSL